MRIMLVTYLGTKRVGLHHTDGVVFWVLIRMIFNIWFDYKGLSNKSNGSAVISGNLDVGLGQANTSIKAYVNYGGHAGNVEIEAR